MYNKILILEVTREFVYMYALFESIIHRVVNLCRMNESFVVSHGSNTGNLCFAIQITMILEIYDFQKQD